MQNVVFLVENVIKVFESQSFFMKEKKMKDLDNVNNGFSFFKSFMNCIQLDIDSSFFWICVKYCLKEF